jgi:hypothetical protein
MAQSKPWHATDDTVHHSNTSCIAGQKIDPMRRLDGQGNKPPCPECGKLNASKK